MKKKILITGGNGFLGLHLAQRLKKNFNIILGSRNNKNNFLVEKKTNCKTFPLDITNINSVRDAINFCKPDIIIHAGATKFVGLSETQPFECADVNIMGSCNIARTAIDKGVKLVIGISTDKATQPIQNFYGMSKAAMEKIFLLSNKLSKTKFLCVRYGNVAWSTGSVLPIWKEMFKKNKTILTTGPYMRRFFFTADDAVDLVIAALENSKKIAGKILCPEMKSSRMIDILKVWVKKFGGKYKIINQRDGDRLDEYLIAENEKDFTKNFYHKKKKYYVIDFSKKIKNAISQTVTSENCQKLSEKEISQLLDLKY
jgi:FlaA1/EpsC-like NDP-sugar epimerase